RVVGTSMAFAQHGTPEEPHVFFRVEEQERFANLQLQGTRRDVHMRHTTLTLGMTYDGPSEVGGLVLHPDFRGHPDKLGRLLSLGRFVFLAMRRGWFRDAVLAELLPPLSRSIEGTRSQLWDALGRRFTGLSYDEADALSRSDKRFIWDLFPMNPVHVSLLPETVEDVIGKVGPESEGARRLLHRIGFRASDRIDPFDGGPHFEAATDEISLVRDARWHQPCVERTEAAGVAAIVGVLLGNEQRFRAVWASVRVESSGEAERADRVALSEATLVRLGLDPSDEAQLATARVMVALRPRRRREDRL
ncbi:MAG: arginine N-succinyltransferase, partial [Nannocystaceae bacterium]